MNGSNKEETYTPKASVQVGADGAVELKILGDCMELYFTLPAASARLLSEALTVKPGGFLTFPFPHDMDSRAI